MPRRTATTRAGARHAPRSNRAGRSVLHVWSDDASGRAHAALMKDGRVLISINIRNEAEIVVLFCAAALISVQTHAERRCVPPAVSRSMSFHHSQQQ